MENDIMPSYKPRITVYTDEKTNQKLAYIAKLENRSSSNYTEYLIKQKIAEYEAEHGEIAIPEKTEKEDSTAMKIVKTVTGVTVGEKAADFVIEKCKNKQKLKEQKKE